MQRFAKPLCIFCLALLAVTHRAEALVVSSTYGGGNSVVDTSFVNGGHAGVDFSFDSGDTASVTLAVERDDVTAGKVTFNSIIRMLTAGDFLRNLLFTLDSGATFGLGDVLTIDGASPVPSGSGGTALVSLVPSTSEIYVGDPIGLGGLDWVINLGGLQIDDTFTLSVRNVDEPGALVLFLGALAAAGSLRRRRV